MSNLFNSLKVTQLTPVWERVALDLSSVILLFVKIRLSIFPFDVRDNLGF